jgi:hypothetical protein
MKERQRQGNSFARIHERRIVIQYNIPVTWTILSELARIIHERFCYNRGLAAPHARLATRLHDFATNRHE